MLFFVSVVLKQTALLHYIAQTSVGNIPEVISEYTARNIKDFMAALVILS